MKLTLEVGQLELVVDPSAAVDISIPLVFDGEQPNCFGAPPAGKQSLQVGDWTGSTRHGGSCNVDVYHLTPHCNGTHTECIGHIVHDEVFAAETLRGGLVPATLITVDPLSGGRTRETTLPNPEPTDRMITAYAIRQALEQWPHAALRRALIIRTAPNPESKAVHQYHAETPPPFLSMEAASLLVEMNVEHVLVDVPSLDRMADKGRLSAHHIFFGLAPGARDAKSADRAQCTVTELIYVPDEIPDGYYLLDLQMPPFMTDAAPSRPLLYQVQNL